MRALSLFSGAGGMDLGLERAGITSVAHCEIDPKAQSVLRRHWPAVPVINDVREVTADVGAVDLVHGGFPCQDISVAGHRRGLDGERSGLWWEFHRILAELRPRWCIIENVAGLLSSNGGRDMGAILGALGDLGYGFAYRVLDARHFGVPQRRRRVFIVGHLGGRGGASVLLEPEGVRGNPASGREAGEELAGTLGGGSGSRGWAPDTDQMTFVPVLTGTVTTAFGPKNYSNLQEVLEGSVIPTTVGTLTAGMERNKMGAPEVDAGLYIPVTNMPTEDTVGAFTQGAHPGGFNGQDAYTGHAIPVAFDTTQITSPTNRSNPKPGDPCHPLSASAHPPAVAFNGFNGLDHQASTEVTPTIRGMAHGVGMPQVCTDLAVRRLTPRECERLMGWPDDWTRWADDGSEIADSHRYRMCGNGVVAPVAEWIGRWIMEADK